MVESYRQVNEIASVIATGIENQMPRHFLQILLARCIRCLNAYNAGIEGVFRSILHAVFCSTDIPDETFDVLFVPLLAMVDHC